MQTKTMFVALTCWLVSATAAVLADGGFFVRIEEVGQAADLAQTRQDVLMAIYSAAPDPDQCAFAEPLEFEVSRRSVDLSLATVGGTSDCGTPGDVDLWYRVRAEGDGTVAFVVWREDGQPVPEAALSVYRGCPENGGALLGCDDPFSAETDVERRVTLPVASGATYFVRVAGPPTLRCTVGTSYLEFPAADACEDAPNIATDLTNVNTSFSATNDAAVDCAGTQGSPDLWYRFTPTADGEVTIAVAERDAEGEPVGLGLSVHGGCPGSDENMLSCVDDFTRPSPSRSELTLSVTAGTTYFIRIAHPVPAEGDQFDVRVTTDPATPQDDADSGADTLPYVTYVLGSRYEGNPSEFAWVIPVPTTPVGVTAHADSSIFADLNEATKPIFQRSFGTAGGGGCGCGAGGGGLGGVRPDDGVEVEASGQAGVFEWAALTSTGSDGLLTWLNANGYAVPAEAGDVLDRYVRKGRHFLALRILEPEQIEQAGDGRIEIPPIQFTCQTTERYYPLAISQVSAAKATEVRVYVVARHRAEAANVANVLIDPEAVEADSDAESGTNYEALFAWATARHGGLALVTEYADAKDPWWMSSVAPGVYPPEALPAPFLTRMRAIVARQDMNGDFAFDDATSDTPVSREFWVTSGGGETAAALGEPMAALGALVLFRSLVRRRGR